MTASHPGPALTWMACLLVFLAGGRSGLRAQPAASRTAADFPVTDGLVRWWPNLFDARDEVTGQEGVVMGVLPPVATGSVDETSFGTETGVVMLRPPITNEVFTLVFWVWCSGARPVQWERLLGQEGSSSEWLFQTSRPDFQFAIARHEWTLTDWDEQVHIRPDSWHHVAIARRPDGTSVIWLDGVRKLDGRKPHAWPADALWLTVGGTMAIEEQQFHGRVSDLCAFDRVLADVEVAALHGAGLRMRPALNTAARRRATRREAPLETSTNVVVAPAASWAHRRFTTEDGLPGNLVKTVLQTHDGYLWVGTDEGLARFDGRRFRAFTPENTPALKEVGHTVWSLAEEADGTLWAGVFGGLIRIRDLELKGFTNGLPQRFILQAQPAGDGSLWVAAFNAFIPRGPCWLRRFHPESGSSSAAVIVPGHPRRLVAVTNGVWVATEQPAQMYFWDGVSAAPTLVGRIDRLPLSVQLANDSALPKDTLIRAWQDHPGRGRSWAEVRLGGSGPAFHWLWDERLTRPWAARWNGPLAGEPWLGVSLDMARVSGSRLEDVDLPAESMGIEVVCLAQNREGGVWFGTEEDGLHLLQERLIRVYTERDGMQGNDVRSVCGDGRGGVWAATADGLNHWRDGAWTFHGRAKFRTVLTDGDGHLWYGLGMFGDYSIGRYRLGMRKESLIVGLEWQDPNSLCLGRDGRLWVACERGLTWARPDRLRRGQPYDLVPDPSATDPAFGRYAVGRELPRIWPVGLVEDADGSMWLGSLEHGLFRIADGQVQAFGRKDGLPGDRCIPVLRDSSGAIWIVTAEGVTRRSGGHFQNATPKDGLPKDQLQDVIEDDTGNLWFSGKRGIHRIPRRELEDFFDGRIPRVRSLTLGPRDGLLTPECSSLHHPSMTRTPDGHIWVATRNGLATFDPKRVRLDTQPLSPLVERLVANRQEVSLGTRGGSGTSGSQTRGPRQLRLPPGSGQQIEFHYTAISLSGADRIRFRHRLEGYDSDWSAETDLRVAFYTNLRPGPYRFLLEAANAHGVWNEVATALSFEIQPRFVETPLFYAGLAALFMALAVAAHRLRLAGQRRLQNLRHQQTLMDEKARIAADMHDELGATLTQIAILGEVAKQQAGSGSTMHSTLDRVSHAAREVTARMSDLVWATNPRNDTLDNLAAYLREHAASQFESTEIRLRLKFPETMEDKRVSATFRRNLLLVMKECLQNIQKHAEATEVSVELAVDGAELVLRIEDNGRGFDLQATRAMGNGLGNMQKRVRDLGGRFQIRSAPGEGARVEVRIPIGETP